jgi:hypothetical protein
VRASTWASPNLDKPEKLLRFNSAQKLRMHLESIQRPKPFQAEYEGSIPFTRSRKHNYINNLQSRCYGINCFRPTKCPTSLLFWFGAHLGFSRIRNAFSGDR